MTISKAHKYRDNILFGLPMNEERYRAVVLVRQARMVKTHCAYNVLGSWPPA